MKRLVEIDTEEGYAAARRFAAWELGDPTWGSLIVNAFIHPEETNALLDAEGADA